MFFKNCLKFLIRNAYFRVGNLVFREVICIPMGSDPAPFFANLFYTKIPHVQLINVLSSIVDSTYND